MTEEKYLELQEIFENEKTPEIKKIKKETLLEFIMETEKRMKKQETEINEELETARLTNENYENLKKTLDEQKDFVDVLIEKNSTLYNEKYDLIEDNDFLRQRLKKFFYFETSVIIILVAILISVFVW